MIHGMGLKFGIHIMRGIPRKSVQANTPIAGSTFTAQTAAVTTSTAAWNSDMYGVTGAIVLQRTTPAPTGAAIVVRCGP